MVGVVDGEPHVAAAGHSVTVVAAANQSVAGTPYEVQIFSLTDGTRVGACGSSNGCTLPPVDWTPETQTYQAFVAPLSSTIPTDAVAQSQPVTVTGQDWTVQLFAAGKNHMTAEAVANRAVGADTSTRLVVYDVVNQRRVLKICDSDKTCSVGVPSKGDGATAYVIPDDADSPTADYLARSGTVSFPDGRVIARNPAGLTDGRPCTCDPVDPADGTLYESTTDISIPGRGPGLALTRSYTSSTAGVPSRFGFGWTDGYTMRLIAAPNDDGSLPTSPAAASNVRVVQENGTTADFAEQADGSFAAPSKVLASLVKNSDGSFTFTRMKRSVFVFNAYGFLTAEKDLHGNTTTLTYDSAGRLAAVTDAAGRTLTYTYNDDGMVAKIIGPGGRADTYGYDGDGNLISATDETGAAWRYGYDSRHELTSLTDPNGHITTNSFEESGRVVAQTDGRGMTTSFGYGDDGVTTITHPAGNMTTLTYRDGLLVQRTEGGGADAATWQYLYDPVTFGLAQVT